MLEVIIRIKDMQIIEIINLKNKLILNILIFVFY